MRLSHVLTLLLVSFVGMGLSMASANLKQQESVPSDGTKFLDIYSETSPANFLALLAQLHSLNKGNKMPETLSFDPAPKTWINETNVVEIFKFVGDQRECVRAHCTLSSTLPKKGPSTLDIEARRMLDCYLSNRQFPMRQPISSASESPENLRDAVLERIKKKIDENLESARSNRGKKE